jgi:EAL domain-containing protein (putative c-di-GMP-specific phosphodiesterase class I)
LEETGLILPVGRWVIRSACQHIAAWRAAGLPVVPVAVNVSARQFHDRDLASDIEFALQDYDVAPSLLEIEITETTMMSSLAETDLILGRLKALGVGISIDDFGTGYSSLAYLKRFPIDRLKIDTAFVRDIATDPDDAAIVMAIISMAHALKLNVVAEGVETADQAEFLCKNGCDYLQGFFIDAPLSSTETGAHLSRGAVPA